MLLYAQSGFDIRQWCVAQLLRPQGRVKGSGRMSITESERMGWWPTIFGLAAVVVGMMAPSFCVTVRMAFTMTAGMPLVEQRGSS